MWFAATLILFPLLFGFGVVVVVVVVADAGVSDFFGVFLFGGVFFGVGTGGGFTSSSSSSSSSPSSSKIII